MNGTLEAPSFNGCGLLTKQGTFQSFIRIIQLFAAGVMKSQVKKRLFLLQTDKTTISTMVTYQKSSVNALELGESIKLTNNQFPNAEIVYGARIPDDITDFFLCWQWCPRTTNLKPRRLSTGFAPTTATTASVIPMEKEEVIIYWHSEHHFNALTPGQQHNEMTNLLNFIRNNNSCNEIRATYPLLFQEEEIVGHYTEIDHRTVDVTSPVKAVGASV